MSRQTYRQKIGVVETLMKKLYLVSLGLLIISVMIYIWFPVVAMLKLVGCLLLCTIMAACAKENPKWFIFDDDD